ncbi:MAG: hypothetical protein AAF724_16330 [Pseudomonadota bacterium]
MKISYATHTVWSNPGFHRSTLFELPDTPDRIADALENFMIHHATAQLLEIRVPEIARRDRQCQSVERLLDAALSRNRGNVRTQRALGEYLYVGSREFALTAASILRSLGIEARLRVGFVDYLSHGYWKKHWLCEYRADNSWKLLDAQLGWRARGAYRIRFGSADVPRDRFLSSSEIWQEIRSGQIKATECGHHVGETGGVWLPAVGMLKDAAALSGFEPVANDNWGPAVAFSRDRAVSLQDYDKLDALAVAFADPPQSPFEARAVAKAFPWSVPGSAITNSVDEVPLEHVVTRRVVRPYHVHARIQEARANV